ncbi:SMP-30/gluconolactonase/LRE family protein [Actinoplanes sp. CA-030573]|uniref:SMP-30/gluconolactonase/LRE family protein n=1 Tax=Actinoplanes sp. CA-030573 TaxID=3239898 RepID=UPI003D8B4D41
MSRRTLAIVIPALLAVTLGATPAVARSHSGVLTSFALPAGFQPEGIAIGERPYAYFGSRADGDIIRVGLVTGETRVINQGPGTPSLGLKLDKRERLFVAGGSGGDARVIDTHNGKVLRTYALQTVPSFINDVALTGGAAWFTDSANPVLFKLPLDRKGKLPAAAVRVPLTGAIKYAAGNNANGIAPTPDGRALIVVQSNTGKLFHVRYDGQTTEIDLRGDNVVNGDGLWLRGRTLYVVQNRLNTITEILLNKDATAGSVISRTTDGSFDVPTTIAEYGKRFYLPNARFTTPATPTTPYDAVSVRIP